MDPGYMDRRLMSRMRKSPLHWLYPWGVVFRSGCPSVTRQEAGGTMDPGGDGPVESSKEDMPHRMRVTQGYWEGACGQFSPIRQFITFVT